MTTAKAKEANFEAAFERLEEILESLTEGTVSLDESLKLYEEANKLIIQCHGRLSQAEKRVEKLIKDRNGQLAMDGEEPLTEDFDGP